MINYLCIISLSYLFINSNYFLLISIFIFVIKVLKCCIFCLFLGLEQDELIIQQSREIEKEVN